MQSSVLCWFGLWCDARPLLEQVRDEEGRRRFHGAFTGGFSAGYYNTVGTKDGWAPATFTSSRKARAAPVQQKPEVDFRCVPIAIRIVR